MNKLYISLYNSELYDGSLLLSEYVYKKEKTKESFKYIILNLYRLGFYAKILDILNDISLDDYDIRLIYYKCIQKTDTLPNNKSHYSSCTTSIDSTNIINKESVELLFISLTKKDILRKDLLIQAFQIDPNNLECLYYLIKEDLVQEKEVRTLLEDCHLKNVYLEIFYPVVSEFFHPFYAYLFSKILYKSKNISKLFSVSHNSYRMYKNSVYPFLSLSLYFMLIKNYEEAKRILLKCLDFDKSDGHVYLYLGISYSRLRECEKSLICFNISNKKMVCTWKTYYYLSCEYQKMTNFDKARLYYKEGLSIDRNIKIQEGFVSLLIFCEDYKEALSYISSIIRSKESEKSNNIYLLKCYCHLFLGNINESNNALYMCEKDYKYYCTKGYIEHLTNNVEKACDFYNKSLLLNNSQVVEDLMSCAIRRNKENDVYNLCTEIFEYLFFNNQEIEVL
jgi:hypothetical protein